MKEERKKERKKEREKEIIKYVNIEDDEYCTRK